MDLDKLSRTQPEVTEFMKSFDPHECSSFDNINDMGQGILNAFTSLKHLVVTTSSNALYKKLSKEPDIGYRTSCLLSSDDSLEMQSFSKDNLEDRIELWLRVKTCCWRLVNIISNTKKTCGSEVLSEYNSNFYIRPVCSPPTIKPIVAAGSINFDYSWADTVRGKLSEIKTASESGVTNSTCTLLNLMNKKVYEEVFGIARIRNIIKTIDMQNGSKIVSSMDNGHIEFGRFPVVDIVKLNIFGNYEVLHDGLSNKRQTEILVNMKGNPFYSEVCSEDKTNDMNTIAIRSMRFKLHRISKLEKERSIMNRRLEELSISDNDLDRVLKLNPFCKNIGSKTVGEQILLARDTLMSANMQSAYSNFDGLRGMMRVFGMRYSCGYGSKGSLTEDCSFMTMMVLMNMACVYKLPQNKDYYNMFKIKTNVTDMEKLAIVCRNKLLDHTYDYPKPIKVLKTICEDSLNSLPSRPSTTTQANNRAEPTLMLKPQWNNSFVLSDRPVDCLMSHWQDEVKNAEIRIKDLGHFDKHILVDKYEIAEDLEQTLEEWGLGIEDKHKKVAPLCSWLARLCENSFKRPKLVYGRGTTKSGIRRLANDMYCFNEDTDFFYDNIFDEPECPNKWSYSSDEYDYYMACCSLLPFCEQPDSFKSTCRTALLRYNEQMDNLGRPRIVVNPNIISDMDVHQDIRFVVACMCSLNGIDFDGSMTKLLKGCLSAKSHNYKKAQRFVKKTRWHSNRSI
jgi:hypothetical protein